MNPLVAEFLGTFILVLIGDGVCANVNLRGTKGSSSGWLVITTGWGLAVFVAVMCTAEYSDAHINPAVTIGLAVAGEFAWDLVAGYVLCQFAGALLGAVFVYLFYVQHFRITDDANAKLGTFCTIPAIRGTVPNVFSEIVGTFVLVLAVLLAVGATVTMDGDPAGDLKVGLGAVGALPVGLIVFAIGIGLGGTSGYAINPARDLGPRIAHAILPIPGKRDSDWSYAWIPVVGPVLGGVAAAAVYLTVI
jgi:glycerol uptake facilitator protein